MNAIDIQVKVQYLPQQSRPAESKFVYAYTIRITNRGEQAAQLVSRHWLITDADNRVQEVRGLGVVGEQPRLASGASYTYTSGAVLDTSTGTMHGSYTMRSDDGEEFEAEIPAFALVPPHALH